MANKNTYKVTINLKQAVVFAILMEHDEGIEWKSSNYVLEKLARLEYNDEPQGILDDANLAKYNAWIKRWMKKDEVESRPAPTLPSL
jgi:hypothetical protein